MQSYILKVECRSRPGIVAKITTYLAGLNCNISDSAQFDDFETDGFFMRVSFACPETVSHERLVSGFAPIADELGLTAQFFDARKKSKILIFVSKFGHCLNDLLYRNKIGALPIEIVGVISNHDTYRELVERNEIDFHHIEVNPDNKPQAEAAQLEIIDDTEADLVVLARYMQVLSDEMCRRMSGRIINIHHSFLPSFKGANPYKQAHLRGVKLIGATSHYVTADLDEGPIIEQDLVRVTHAQNVSDFVALGRDVESQVLSRAIHAHIHQRTFIAGEKTIVFPPSPGSYASEKMG